jgi:hypothetical protein
LAHLLSLNLLLRVFLSVHHIQEEEDKSKMKPVGVVGPTEVRPPFAKPAATGGGAQPPPPPPQSTSPGPSTTQRQIRLKDVIDSTITQTLNKPNSPRPQQATSPTLKSILG